VINNRKTNPVCLGAAASVKLPRGAKNDDHGGHGGNGENGGGNGGNGGNGGGHGGHPAPSSSSSVHSSIKSTSSAHVSSKTSATSSSSSILSSSTTQACLSTYSASNTYLKEQSHGVGYRYNAPSLYGTSSLLNTVDDEATGVAQCKSACDQIPACRGFSWANYTSQAECTFNSSPYNASFFVQNSDYTDPPYTVAYNVSNFVFPSEILPNGLFEEACFGPWSTGPAHDGSNVTAVVLPCAPGQCAPGGGDFYVHAYGQPPSVSQGAIGLSNMPVIIPGVNYTMACYIQVVAGYARTFIGTNTVFFESTALEPAPGWQTLSLPFVGNYGAVAQVDIAYTPPFSGQTAYFESLLNGCTVVES
jgi:hypothetical protein